MITYVKTGSRHVENTQLRSYIPSGLLTRLCSFRLPLVFIGESRACWAAFCLVRRCEKMARRMVRSKRGRFLHARYSQIAGKMRKTYNKRWSTSYHSSEFNVVFFNFTFHICTPLHYKLCMYIHYKLFYMVQRFLPTPFGEGALICIPGAVEFFKCSFNT